MNKCIVYKCVSPNDFSLLKLWHHGAVAVHRTPLLKDAFIIHGLCYPVSVAREYISPKTKTSACIGNAVSHHTHVKTKENALLYSNYLRRHLNPSRVALVSSLSSKPTSV